MTDNSIEKIKKIFPNNSSIVEFFKKVNLDLQDISHESLKEILSAYLHCHTNEEKINFETLINEFKRSDDYQEKYDIINSIIFNQPKFNEGEIYVNQEIYLEYNSSVGFEGFGKCHKCKGTKLIPELKQTRGADEGFTTKFKCPSCNVYVKGG